MATDALLKLVNEVEPKATLKYNKHYIRLELDESTSTLVTFMPRKAHVIMTVKLPQTKETDDQLEEAGVETLSYESRFRQYRIRLETQVGEKQRDLLRRLIQQARDIHGNAA